MIRVLLPALLLAGNAAASDVRSSSFEETLAGHRAALGTSARKTGRRGLAPVAAGVQGRPASRTGDPCLRHPSLDKVKLRWVFQQEGAQFYVKHPPLEVDFGPGACEAYYPPPEAHHGDAPQAIRRLPGSKEFDLVLYSDAGSEEIGVVLLTKEGLQAVAYGYYTVERLLDKTAIKLPRLPVAKSLTESMKGEALLVAVTK